MKRKPVLATVIVGVGMVSWCSFIGAKVGSSLTTRVQEDAIQSDRVSVGALT